MHLVSIGWPVRCLPNLTWRPGKQRGSNLQNCQDGLVQGYQNKMMQAIDEFGLPSFRAIRDAVIAPPRPSWFPLDVLRNPEQRLCGVKTLVYMGIGAQLLH